MIGILFGEALVLHLDVDYHKYNCAIRLYFSLQMKLMHLCVVQADTVKLLLSRQDIHKNVIIVIRTVFRLMSRDCQLPDWQFSITSRIIEKLLKAALGSLMSYREKLSQPNDKRCQEMLTRAQDSLLHQLRIASSTSSGQNWTEAFPIFHSVYSVSAALPAGREKEAISLV